MIYAILCYITVGYLFCIMGYLYCMVPPSNEFLSPSLCFFRFPVSLKSNSLPFYNIPKIRCLKSKFLYYLCLNHWLQIRFAHGKEELRPTRLHNKSKFEAQACKTYAITGSSTNSSKHRSVHPVAAVAALAPQPGAAMTVVQNTSIITAKNSNWSPQDDGIEVSLPSSSGKHTSREEIDFYIHGLLFGPPPRKRLPCFTQLCPENPALFPS